MFCELKEIKNSNLFDLINAKKNGISNDVNEYLQANEFPWQALGENLTKFVKKCIAQVPVAQRKLGKIHPTAVVEGEDVVICEGAIVEAGAFITGPTYIESGAIIRHGAYIRGSVYVCTEAVVGHTTEAKGTLLLPKAKAAHFAYVGDSLLGVDANLGAGTKLANLRFDHGKVNIYLETQTGLEKIATGLKKFGAIIGNSAQTGCNSVTNPGTIMLKNSMVLPTTTAKGVIFPS